MMFRPDSTLQLLPGWLGLVSGGSPNARRALRAAAKRTGLLALFALGATGLAHGQDQAEHSVRLDSGFELRVAPEFSRRDRLWADTALVYKAYRDLYSVDGGAKQGRLVFHNERNYGLPWTPGAVWSSASKELLVWLDEFDQLTAVDARDGTRRQLTSLPTHVWNLEFRQHMDPSPVTRDAGVVLDPGRKRLLFVVQEETNEQVAPWQRRDDRSGAAWIASVALATGETTLLPPEGVSKGRVLGWDISTKRQQAYLVIETSAGRQLVVQSLEGKDMRVLPLPTRDASRVALSPDQATLLIERVTTLPAPAAAKPKQDDETESEAMPDTRSPESGFEMLDLESAKTTDGPTLGYCCSWSPDGKLVAYLTQWDLCLYDVSSGETTVVASREASDPDGTSAYQRTPVWSPDGSRLAACLGGNWKLGRDDYATLLLDLKSKEFLVLPATEFSLVCSSYDCAWVPTPKPFPDGIK
jgi:WD40 repeat protein